MKAWKARLGVSVAIIFASFNLLGQSGTPISGVRKSQIDKIVDLIRNDRISQLSELVSYPLARPNPIPNIESKESFILYYPTLFDAEFKQKLINAKFSSENTIDNYMGCGLLQGDIWLEDNGKITTINHSSPSEIELQRAMTREIASWMYPSVKEWKKNLVLCKSKVFLIRVDLLDDNSLRYISWSNPKTISDKPDLVLYKGDQEFHGTIGGERFTFKNGEWTYIVDYFRTCEKEQNCGWFLTLLQNGQEKSKTRLTEIK